MIQTTHRTFCHNVGGRNYTLRSLRPLDFLEHDLPISIFEKNNKGVGGVFEQLQAELGETQEKQTEEAKKAVDLILSLAVSEMEIPEEHKDELFSAVLISSFSTFERVYKVSQKNLLTYHSMAEKYGGKPSDYAKMPLDEYMFNRECLFVGIDDQNKKIEKAEREAKRKSKQRN